MRTSGYPIGASASFLRGPLKGASPELILAYFQSRRQIRYFPLIDEEESERRKMDAILENRFEFNHEAHDLLPDFDWLRNPSADEEWLILLHKFYYAAGLGRAFDQTGDLRYFEKWTELTARWILKVPPGFLTSDVAGRRIQNWISAHYYFVSRHRLPELDPGFYVDFLASLHRQVTRLCDNLTPARNHRTLELTAIFFAAVIFPEFEDAGRWLEFSCNELLENMRTDLLADGVHCELSLDYHHIVLRNYLTVRRLAQLNQVPLPAEMDAHLSRALEFAMHSHTPEGVVPAVSDGDRRSFLPLLEEGASIFNSDPLRYVATKGREGAAPAEACKAFPQSGYYILRSGWGGKERFEDERYLLMDCGPLGEGNHGHLDLLSFEMAAYGRSLIVDPGRYTYDESGEINWRVLFRGTSYHNTVVVDGMNQTRYEFHKRKFKIRGPAAVPEVKRFVASSELAVVQAVARSYEYDAVHEREVYFIHGEYWVIRDRLTAGSIHRYDLLFHLSPEAQGRTSVTEAGRVAAPHLELLNIAPPGCRAYIDPGYVSHRYGEKMPAPVVRFTASGSDAAFVTVLFPFREERPAVHVALSGDVIEIRHRHTDVLTMGQPALVRLP